MQEIDGRWIMDGPDWDDPKCIHTIDEAIEYINEMGFLPLFSNEISDFSLEERTAPECWWCEDPEKDPWMWRAIIARSGNIAYGKFFDKKAGFITKEWLPYFVNYRRNGYDFDALWDDEKASVRQKKIMDLFDDDTEIFSFEVKQRAGFGKGGEKNFEGVVTGIQMQTYLCMRDFRKKKSKAGREYGWDIAIYSKPEHLWGYDYVTSRYNEAPEESWQAIVEHIRKMFKNQTDESGVTDKQIKKVLK